MDFLRRQYGDNDNDNVENSGDEQTPPGHGDNGASGPKDADKESSSESDSSESSSSNSSDSSSRKHRSRKKKSRKNARKATPGLSVRNARRNFKEMEIESLKKKVGGVDENS